MADHAGTDDKKLSPAPSHQLSVQDGHSQEGTLHATALKLAAAHQDQEIDPHMEKKLLRKIDWRLMPLMCATYALQYYDKAIIGHAAIFGLRDDLDLLEGLRYSNTTMVFYCGFILGCYPISLLAQKLPTAKVCAVICFLWGAVVLSTLGCNSYAGFMINRFFLGLIESGVSPAFMLVTSKWYTNEEQVLRSGLWYSCSGGANLITPLINYGLGNVNGQRIAGWQVMYLFAGLLTVVWSSVIWVFFPDSPATAKHLTEDERAFAILRLRSNNTGFENSKLSLPQLKETLLSYQFWSVFILSMLCSTASGASNTFASLVFNGMGFSIFHTLLLNIPLGAMALITIIGSGYLGRKFAGMRHRIYTLACIPVIIGCCLLWQLGSFETGGRVAGVYLVTFFGSCYVQVIAFGTSNFAGYTKKTVVAAGIFVAYCLGNIIGPLLFDAKYAPGYNESFTGIMICFAIAMVVCEATRFMLARENARRDREYGPPGFSQGLEDLTEKENKDFRYQL